MSKQSHRKTSLKSLCNDGNYDKNGAGLMTISYRPNRLLLVMLLPSSDDVEEVLRRPSDL